MNHETVDARFDGVARLYGRDALAVLQRKAVAVIGLGGVGSWVAEALARTGVGRLVLMDLDDVCVGNTNRQAHAVQSNIGRSKVEATAERVKAINPAAGIEELHAFLGEATLDRLWDTQPDLVIDAIDRASTKALLIDAAKRVGVPIVTVGGAGGRVDPTRVQTVDLTRAFNDTLLATTRKQLRQKHGFERNVRKKFGVPCVFSPELPRPPEVETCEPIDVASGPKRLDCATGYGSSVMVTGVFAFQAAAAAVDLLIASGCDHASEHQLAKASTSGGGKGKEKGGNDVD